MTLTKQDFDEEEFNSEFQYELPDTHAVFHEGDENLDPIKIELPKIEEFFSKHLEREVSYDEAITMIDGYGLARSDQFFSPVESTKNIKKLYLTVSRNLNVAIKDVKEEMLYEEINNNPDYYKTDILFIQREIFRRYNGYWFFNNGKPTYITGWHYFFLNYWKLNNSGENDNRPYYRDKQRRMAIFYDWAYKYDKKVYKYVVLYRLDGVERPKGFNDYKKARAFCTEVTAKGGFAFLDTRRYEEISTGRTIHGVTQPKTRREGYTAFICCMMFCIVTEKNQMNAWIQGLTEDDSLDKIFKQGMVEPIYQLPFFFKPFHNNDKYIKPSNEYVFTYPSRLQMMEVSGLLPPPVGSVIKPYSSAYRKIDGTRAGVIYRDECGKDRADGTSHDINLWWRNVAKRTLEFGNVLVGFAFLGSTVGDLSGNGGRTYKLLCDASHDRTRDENGNTSTGLINLFFAAYDGMQGFIDKFGMSVIDDPSPDGIMGQNGQMIYQGAKSFLANKRQELLQIGDIQGYINEIREMPWTWDEAWTPSVGDSGMPVIPMRNRYSELIFAPVETWANYRLEWVNGKKFGEVYAVEDPAGKWVFVKEFFRYYRSEWRNKKDFNYLEQTYSPPETLASKIYVGVDPFMWSDKNTIGNHRRSKGAIGVFWPFDERVDRNKEGKDVFTNDYMGFFNHRTADTEEFSEEAAKCAIFLSANCNVETNIPETLKDFQKWKIDGYVMYDLDKDGNEKDVRGVKADEINKQGMFNLMESFFNNNAYRVKLPQILDCWMKIPTPKSLTDHDLCAATGWAMDGARKNDVQEQPTSYYQSQGNAISVVHQAF